MLYSYTATTNEGVVSRGSIEAGNREAAIDTLTRQGLLVVSVKEQGKATRISSGKRELFGRIKFYEYIAFVDHLSTMLKVGYPITEAVDVLRSDTENPIMKEVLNTIRFQLEKGQTFSSVLAKYPKYFSPIFISLVKSGEASGTLESVLEHLAVQLRKDYELRKKVKSALVYPIFLLVLTLLVMLGMFIFILPRLTKVFSQSGVELPITTKILLAISNALSANIPLTLVGASIAAVGVVAAVRSRAGKHLMMEAGFRLPVVKKLIKQVFLARFSRTLSSLLGSGISILEAIDLTADVVSNTQYERVVRDSKKGLERGVPLSAILARRSDLFPHLAISMLSVGEKSGTMDAILKKLADFYEVEVDGSLKDLVTFLEPVMLFLIAFMIGFLALAVITPIYSLVGSIG